MLIRPGAGRKEILKEKNELSCACDIMSWAKMVSGKSGKHCKDSLFIRKLMWMPKIRRSARCQLSCYYALAMLGNRHAVRNITTYLEAEDYQIRSVALNLMWEFRSPDTMQLMEERIDQALRAEKNKNLSESMRELLDEIASMRESAAGKATKE